MYLSSACWTCCCSTVVPPPTAASAGNPFLLATASLSWYPASAAPSITIPTFHWPFPSWTGWDKQFYLITPVLYCTCTCMCAVTKAVASYCWLLHEHTTQHCSAHPAPQWQYRQLLCHQIFFVPQTLLTTHNVVPAGMWTLCDNIVWWILQGGVAEEDNTHHII